jgi:hypothetical protein
VLTEEGVLVAVGLLVGAEITAVSDGRVPVIAAVVVWLALALVVA